MQEQHQDHEPRSQCHFRMSKIVACLVDILVNSNGFALIDGRGDAVR